MPPKPSYNRGDVVLVLYPNSDLRTARTRPAPLDNVIVQADNLQTGLPQVIVAMITGRLFRANHPSRVVVTLSTAAGQQSGLLTDSVVMTDNLATVAGVAIDRVIGTLPMADIDTALRHTLKLRPYLIETEPQLARAANKREALGGPDCKSGNRQPCEQAEAGGRCARNSV